MDIKRMTKIQELDRRSGRPADRALSAELRRAKHRSGQNRKSPSLPQTKLARKVRAGRLEPGCFVELSKDLAKKHAALGHVTEGGRLTREGYVYAAEKAIRIGQAVDEYSARQDRRSHPIGTFDKAGRWYPDEIEECDEVYRRRSPSRSYPYSYMIHCRTAKHIAWLYGVDRAKLLRVMRG